MYVEFYSDFDILEPTLRRTAEVTVDVRNVANCETVPLRLVCVVQSRSLDGFERAVAEDETIAEAECLSATEQRGLYRLTAVADTVAERGYERAVEVGGIYLASRNSDEGWYNKMNFPDRESFRRYQATLTDHGVDVQPTVIRDRAFFLSQEAFGLTPKQQAVLAEAIKVGYFEVPRRASLSDVAERLGISDQAASERLRRGMKTVAENCVAEFFDEDA
jgi:hypothetical protein